MAANARHVIGYHLSQETRVHHSLDDVASDNNARHVIGCHLTELTRRGFNVGLMTRRARSARPQVQVREMWRHLALHRPHWASMHAGLKLFGAGVMASVRVQGWRSL